MIDEDNIYQELSRIVDAIGIEDIAVNDLIDTYKDFSRDTSAEGGLIARD